MITERAENVPETTPKCHSAHSLELLLLRSTVSHKLAKMMFKPILALTLLVSTVVTGYDPQSEYISHKISKRYLTSGHADKKVDAARTMTARSRLALMQRDLIKRSTSNVVEHSVVSGELNNLILDLHNDLRATVMPPATYMQDMTWSDDIAQHAADWAQCGEHFNQHREDDNNLNNYGENLFVLETSASYTASLEKKIMIGLNVWWNEKENYNFDDNSCIHDTCDHYKQMAWAESNVIGCGYALNCPIEGKPWFTSSFYLVCNYSPQ
ncbi:Cysteine-rich secretory protein 2 [Lamellibrachia satsuma]|nr:Cysteine-rich secretory protein 2 [Lamellibrachia satsuma]